MAFEQAASCQYTEIYRESIVFDSCVKNPFMKMPNIQIKSTITRKWNQYSRSKLQ
jgi:hypothetical protein